MIKHAHTSCARPYPHILLLEILYRLYGVVLISNIFTCLKERNSQSRKLQLRLATILAATDRSEHFQRLQ